MPPTIPFKTTKSQKIGSIIAIFVGAFLLFSTIPFIPELGIYAVLSIIGGFIISMIALGYFLDTVS